ncbi:DUF4142 domain-containing protein [Cereibacter sphaeroides]|uniref:DUF4142 domain-containing protein n=1 Tax=Cereibacter sphaeroides TaxID=1063 RepID=UPI001F3EC11D|nr:DUF4142 domain-containing protein [Cereibacter sphaeroides]MCE6949743.1 DUF4142 domain-containing protein [Cereibacter sphaeroides]
MIRTLTAATMAATLHATAVWPQAATVTDPAEFVQKAAASGMFEIQSSQAALDKGVEGEVADFAQRMVEDHTDASERLKAAATEAGVEVPAALDAEHQSKLETLKAAEADALVKGYVDAQVQGHEQAVQLFESFSTGGPDGPLKDFAAETLPTLREHAEMIKEIAGQ